MPNRDPLLAVFRQIASSMRSFWHFVIPALVLMGLVACGS